MSKQKNIQIVMCGVGGQGTILASRLIAAAAMRKGMHVQSAETIGMAQRGGSVFTHLKIGDEIHSPRIGAGRADLIIGFEPAEAVRMLPFLKEGGSVVVSSAPILPVSAMIGASEYPEEEILGYLRDHVERLTLVDGEKAAKDLGSAKCLNVVLLGAALQSGCLPLTQEELLEELRALLPRKLHTLNERALRFYRETNP